MHKIRFNKKHGTNDPVITVKTSHSNRYAHEVDILGPSTVIYRPDKPLSCGATNDPVITVKTSHSNRYAHKVVIDGPSEVIYRPDKPLSCGARVWIETHSEVRLS